MSQLETCSLISRCIDVRMLILYYNAHLVFKPRSVSKGQVSLGTSNSSDCRQASYFDSL